MPVEKLGPYHITKTVGRGGMGTVYAGRHEETGELVAVKILATGSEDDPRFRTRFSAEIETLKKLKHPNIVKLLGYGEDDGKLFYSMELVAGSNLQQELRKGRLFIWREVARIGVQICDALKHAHDNGVIHRDLKPANILYDEKEQSIKLTDFGIAKLWGSTSVTSVGGVVGTADYMSPEQAAGKPIAAQSDLYSLGAVMFTLLTGRPPFIGTTPTDVIHSLQYSDPPSVCTLRDDIPAGFDAIIMQLLAKNPRDRVATARVLANQLRAMEYALSVETQVADSVDEADNDPAEGAKTDGGMLDTALTEENFTSQDAAHEAATVVPDSSAERLAQPAAATRFTTVMGQSGDLPAADVQDTEQEALWPKVLAGTALVLILVGIVFWSWSLMQTPDADSLYDAIVTAANEGDRARLRNVQPTIELFLEKHGDEPRAKNVRVLQQDLESHDLFRQIDRRATRSGGSDFISPLVEQAFYVAMQNRRSNPTLARQQFQQLIDVFDQPNANERTLQCLECARHELLRMESTVNPQEEELAADLQAQLQQAEATLAEAELRSWREGVIALFGSKPWAQDVVAQCRQALAEAP